MRYVERKRAIRLRAVRRLAVAIAAASGGLAACNTDALLKVSAPSLLPADPLFTPARAGLLVNGAVADFECAFASAALVEGLISDEFADSQPLAATWDYDRRTANQHPQGAYGTAACDGDQRPGIYTPLSTARYDADAILRALQGWTAADVGATYDSLTATAAVYAGFSYTMLGMSMCEAAVDLGPDLSQAQMFGLAEERFTTALDPAARLGSTSLLDAAYLGRARVRLFQGNLSGADADAARVPAGFAFDATYSEANPRRYNRIFSASRYFPVEPVSRHLTVEGVPDPRVPVDSTTRAGREAKWTGLADPIRIASYDEAQLILAEARGGQAAIGLINGLRDEWDLPHYPGPTDAASVKSLIIAERRAILWGEGQRNYDYQRFELPFTYAPEGTPFHSGSEYGTTTCLPLPDIERLNNPNLR